MRVFAAVLLVLFATRTAPAHDSRVDELMQSLAGKENLPAGEVFKNVQLLKSIPAGTFVRIMDAGYSRALGVGCDHCHTDDWAADDKRPKRAAREMILLVNDINTKLGAMREIDNTEPAVNCTTCHRGFVKPALQMK